MDSVIERLIFQSDRGATDAFEVKRVIYKVRISTLSRYLMHSSLHLPVHSDSIELFYSISFCCTMKKPYIAFIGGRLVLSNFRLPDVLVENSLSSKFFKFRTSKFEYHSVLLLFLS